MSGNVAVITGGSGALGGATACALANRGVTVALVDKRLGNARITAEKCTAQGGRAKVYEVDQSDARAVAAVVDTINKDLGRIDYLFANAGWGKFSTILDLSVEEWNKTILINLSGTFYFCQSVARKMVEKSIQGSIVITASSGAETPIDRVAAYDCSKAACVMLAKHLACELGQYRIRANAILPGVIESGMTAPMLNEVGYRRMLERGTPLGRWGRAEEVADLVEFLLSDRSAYINGAAIRIDGGASLRGLPKWFDMDYSENGEKGTNSEFQRYPYI